MTPPHFSRHLGWVILLTFALSYMALVVVDVATTNINLSTGLACEGNQLQAGLMSSFGESAAYLAEFAVASLTCTVMLGIHWLVNNKIDYSATSSKRIFLFKTTAFLAVVSALLMCCVNQGLVDSNNLTVMHQVGVF